MDTLEQDLAALLAQDGPGPDAAFTLAVMTRIERRRLRRELLRNGAIALGMGAVLLPLAPALGAGLQGLHGNVMAMLLLVGTALAAMQWSLRQIDG
jgi:hypothetical protein